MDKSWSTCTKVVDKAFWSNGVHSKFKVVELATNDCFDLDDSEAAGVYIWVTMNFGPWQCKEMLYSMSRHDPVFWVCSRDWTGPPTRGKKFKRDSIYPVGSKVRLNHVRTVSAAAGANNQIFSNAGES